MKTRHGFTLVELTASLLLLLVAGLIVPLGMARENARMSACRSNLKAISTAAALYAASSSDVFPFPLLKDQGDPNADVKAGQETDEEDFSSMASALGDNAMQNVWLLIKDGAISANTFHCPSDRNWSERKSTVKYGWTAPNQFSYGLHFPYAKDPNGKENPLALSDANLVAGLVVMADQNPGGEVNAGRPPSNHYRKGECFVLKDTAAAVYQSVADSKAGLGGDDIYINAQGKVGGLPAKPDNDKYADTSICTAKAPAASDGQASTQASRPASR